MSGRLNGPAAWLLYPITVAVMIFILAPLLVTVAISVRALPSHGTARSWPMPTSSTR